MQLAVSSRSSLPRYQNADIRYVVSLPDPGTESEPLVLPKRLQKILQMRFHDVDDIEMHAPQFRRCQAPTEEHVRKVMQFFSEISQAESGGGDQFAILVHCESGLSRSAASAIIGLTCLGYDAQTAFDIVCEANPHSLPNRRMLRIADEIFQTTNLEQIASSIARRSSTMPGTRTRSKSWIATTGAASGSNGIRWLKGRRKCFLACADRPDPQSASSPPARSERH